MSHSPIGSGILSDRRAEYSRTQFSNWTIWGICGPELGNEIMGGAYAYPDDSTPHDLRRGIVREMVPKDGVSSSGKDVLGYSESLDPSGCSPGEDQCP